MDELLQVFVAESRDMLAQMEGMLLELERHPTDTDTVNAVFRVAHTSQRSAVKTCRTVLLYGLGRLNPAIGIMW